MRNLISATARYLRSRPLLVAFLMIGAADALGKTAMAALSLAA